MGREKSHLRKLSNKLKAAGLQKLRWYCQACQKQCRDDNGFKLHCMSEGHQRQMLLVAENPGRVVHGNSEEFRNSFLSLLRRSYNTRRVHSNVVYNDYISDKNHLHMNSTRWHTLTEFIKYLGREGYCLVDETPKGWYIQWIDRDPENLARQKRIEKMDAAQRSEEERQAEIVREQMERDRQAALERGETFEAEYTGLNREDDNQKIVFSLASAPENEKLRSADGDGAAAAAEREDGEDDDDEEADGQGEKEEDDDDLGVKPDLLKAFGVDAEKLKKQREEAEEAKGAKRKLSNLELLRLENEEKKAKMQQCQQSAAAAASSSGSGRNGDGGDRDVKGYWLHKNIVVKVMHKELADGRYYKRKGVVEEVIDRYAAKVQLLDSKTALKLDQEYLETVIPQAGGRVLIVNGRHRGLRGRLESLDIDRFCAQIMLREGPNRGDVVTLPYEHFSKLAEEES